MKGLPSPKKLSAHLFRSQVVTMLPFEEVRRGVIRLAEGPMGKVLVCVAKRDLPTQWTLTSSIWDVIDIPVLRKAGNKLETLTATLDLRSRRGRNGSCLRP